MKNKDWSISLEEGHHKSIVKSFFKDCGVKPIGGKTFELVDHPFVLDETSNRVMATYDKCFKNSNHFTLPTQWNEAKEYICEEEHKCVTHLNLGFKEGTLNLLTAKEMFSLIGALDDSEKVFIREDTPKLEAGKWYKIELNNGVIANGRYSCFDINLNFFKDWICDQGYSDKIGFCEGRIISFIELPPQEVEEHLVDCANHRGLVKGAKVKDLDGGESTLGDFLTSKFYYKYHEIQDSLNGLSSPLLYKKGKWAEVVESEIVCSYRFTPVDNHWTLLVVEMGVKGTHETYNIIHNGDCINEHFKTEQEAKNKAEQVKEEYLKSEK